MSVQAVEVFMAAIVEPEVATYQQYVDGEWIGAEDGGTYEVINPSTEDVMALAPASTTADARRAVAAARRSFDAGDWRLKSQLQRTQI
ncbi:MAG: aldehyde dehydrogenase family protein, partial [Solirubrobacterales bacterium]